MFDPLVDQSHISLCKEKRYPCHVIEAHDRGRPGLRSGKAKSLMKGRRRRVSVPTVV